MSKEKQVILAIGAHPDDMEFTASGTVAKLIEEGWDAYYIIATDGSRGSSDPKMTHKKLAAIRRKEQLQAAKILGLKDVFFLNYIDTQLAVTLRLQEQLVRIIRQVKPAIVITMDPLFYYTTQMRYADYHFVNHQDHRAIGEAAMNACFPLARDLLSFPQHHKNGLLPHNVKELWLVNFEKGNHTVDITGTFEKKLQALAVHKSQLDDFPRIKERLAKWAIAYGEEEGFAFAESFIRLQLKD